MTVLVSGASGFLGTRLTAALSAAGREVIALTRGEVPDNAPQASNIRWVKCDLSSKFDADALPDVSAVIHLAGTGWARGARADRLTDESYFLSNNEETALNVFEAFCRRGVKRFVMASSQVVYGSPGSLAVDEDFPLAPTASAYACSKVNAENWSRYFHAKFGGTFRILRLSGFVDCGGVVDYFIDRAQRGEPIELLARGEVRRDYLSSADGIQAILKALYAEPDGTWAAFNIGSGQALSTGELARIVCEALASPSSLVPLDAPAPQTDFVFDISRARDALGFDPGSLPEAVRAHALRRAAVKR